MIVDSHCHAWRHWPYQPPVPDPDSRGRVEQLLWEMDRAGVDRAVLVCARIDHNPDNNAYGYESVSRHRDRLDMFADVDCFWSDTYHAPGAADRLSAAIDQYHLKGFTHYVRADDDGTWYLSAEGRAFWQVAARRRQIASLAIPWRLQPVLRQVAAAFPDITFLCHHMAGARVADPASIAEIARSTETPNIWVKLSGFHYASQVEWGFPYDDCEPIVRVLYHRFGPERLCWGSDYPVVRHGMTYRQSLEALRSRAPFIAESEMGRILGGTLADLLARSG